MELFRPFTAAAAFWCVTGTGAQAALLINTTAEGTSTSSVNLSELGTTNWAAWDVRNNTAAASLSATTQKAGPAVGTISAITPTGTATAVRGTTSTGNYPTGVFSWSAPDATGAALNPDGRLVGIFPSTLDDTTSGLQFSITNLPALAGGETYLISVLASGYRARGELTATAGALSASQLGNAKGDTKSTDLYQFEYNPDAASDTLALTYIAFSETPDTANSHVVLQAVAISVIPEPSSALLAASSLLALGLRRRR